MIVHARVYENSGTLVGGSEHRDSSAVNTILAILRVPLLGGRNIHVGLMRPPSFPNEQVSQTGLGMLRSLRSMVSCMLTICPFLDCTRRTRNICISSAAGILGFRELLGQWRFPAF